MKIRISNTQLNTALDYFIVILFTAVVLAAVFFALPKTENLLPAGLIGEHRFDLNTKGEDYRKQEFYLKLDTEDVENVDQKIEKTRDILYRRLREAGVEEIQIKRHDVEDSEGLRVTVQTVDDERRIGSLIAERTYMMLVVPTEGFEYDPNDPELDVFEVAEMHNYEKTKWDRTQFRNILIRPLLDTEGNRTYFAIFKTWPQDQGEFSRFLREYEGTYIGFAIDDFVTPVKIEEHSEELFAVGFGPDPDRALFYDIALNSGVIPLEYENTEVIDIDPEVYEVNHLQVTLAIIASILILTSYLSFREQEKQKEILNFGFSLLLVFAISFTFLKLYQIPVDLFLLIITTILTIILLKMICLRNEDTKAIVGLSLASSAIMILTGSGYVLLLGQYLLFVILVSLVVHKLTQYYFDKIKIIFA